MSVIINFKICDNAEECNGIAECPTGALSWDEVEKTIVIDNVKCTSCGICERACMVSAIKVAKTDVEIKKIQAVIESDPRRVSDLYLDRYGAMPILPAFYIKEPQFEREVLHSNKLTVAEIYENDGVMCLVKSIPITELFDGLDIKYRKVEVENDSLKGNFRITTLPALLFFSKGELFGKIEGYYPLEEKEKLKNEINKIVEKVKG